MYIFKRTTTRKSNFSGAADVCASCVKTSSSTEKFVSREKVGAGKALSYFMYGTKDVVPLIKPGGKETRQAHNQTGHDANSAVERRPFCN